MPSDATRVSQVQICISRVGTPFAVSLIVMPRENAWATKNRRDTDTVVGSAGGSAPPFFNGFALSSVPVRPSQHSSTT